MNAPIDNLSYYVLVEYDGGTRGVVRDKRPTYYGDLEGLCRKLVSYGFQRPSHRFAILFQNGPTFFKVRYFVEHHKLYRMDSSGVPATACADIRKFYYSTGKSRDDQGGVS